MAITHIHKFEQQDSSRDARDDATQIALATQGVGIEQTTNELLTELWNFSIESSNEFKDIGEKIEKVLGEILKALGGGTGGGGTSGGGSPPTPGGPSYPGGPSGGGGGGTSPIDKLTEAIKKLDQRMAGFGDEFQSKTARVMNLLTSNISDLGASQKKISGIAGLSTGAGLGAGVGMLAPVIGPAIGAAIGGLGGIIVSAISGDKEKGQKVEVINWADFKMTPDEDTTLGSIVTTALKGAGWLVLPQILTSGFFGQNKDQSFQVSNWPDSGISDVYKEIQHTNVILNAINGVLGGSYIGERKEEKQGSGLAIPLISAAIAPITATVSLISGIINWFREKPEAKEAPTLIGILESLGNFDTTRLEQIQIEILGFTTSISQTTLQQELLLLEIREEFMMFSDAFTQLLVYAQQQMVASLAADTTTTAIVQELKDVNLGLDKIHEDFQKKAPTNSSEHYYPKGMENPAGIKIGGRGMSGDERIAYQEVIDNGGSQQEAYEAAAKENKNKKADGGEIPGQDGVGENEDEVDIKATKGEFIVNKNASQKHRKLLEGINSEHFASGGSVGHYFTGGVVELPAIGAALSSLGPTITALAPQMAALSPVVTALAASLYLVKGALDVSTSGLTTLASILYIIVGAFTSLATAVIAMPLQFAEGVLSVGKVVNDIFGKLASGDIYGALAVAPLAAVGALGKMTDSMFGWIPIVGGIFGQLTSVVTGAINVFTQFMGQMTPFVQKISPATVENFNQQISNLQATIGVAFMGIVNIMADTVQKIGGILLPVSEELAPIFNQLGELIQSTLLPIFKVLVTFIQVLISPVAAVFGQLRQVVIDVVRSFVLLTAMFARMFGMNDFLQRLIGNMQRPEGPGAIAVGSASMTDFARISSDIAVAAAQASAAGAGNAPRTQTNIMEDILGEIQTISGESIDDLIDRAGQMIIDLKAGIIAKWEEFQEEAEGWFDEIYDRIAPVIDRILTRLWETIRTWVSTQFPGTTQVVEGIQDVGNRMQEGLEVWRNDPEQAIRNNIENWGRWTGGW